MYLCGVRWQGLAVECWQPALQDKLVHPLPAAVSRQEVSVAQAEPCLPCCLEGGACRSEFEALCAGTRHPGYVRLELQHQRAVVARHLAHARLTALLLTVERGTHTHAVRGGERAVVAAAGLPQGFVYVRVW